MIYIDSDILTVGRVHEYELDDKEREIKKWYHEFNDWLSTKYSKDYQLIVPYYGAEDFTPYKYDRFTGETEERYLLTTKNLNFCDNEHIFNNMYDAVSCLKNEIFVPQEDSVKIKDDLYITNNPLTYLEFLSNNKTDYMNDKMIVYSNHRFLTCKYLCDHERLPNGYTKFTKKSNYQNQSIGEIGYVKDGKIHTKEIIIRNDKALIHEINDFKEKIDAGERVSPFLFNLKKSVHEEDRYLEDRHR